MRGPAAAFAIPLLALAVAAPIPAVAAAPDAPMVETRSFPRQSAVRADLLGESVGTDVEADSDWGGIETLDVPLTESQAERDAKEKARQEEEARQQARAEASRSAERTAIAPPASGTGQAVAEYALRFAGYPYVAGGDQPTGWDCSGFVQYVFAQFGVRLPHGSAAQMSAGSPVGSLAEARPGDILANGHHAAIYIGNGMVMNAMNPVQGTRTASVAVMGGSYAIRRVL